LGSWTGIQNTGTTWHETQAAPPLYLSSKSNHLMSLDQPGLDTHLKQTCPMLPL